MAYFGDLSQISASILAISEVTRSGNLLKMDGLAPKGLLQRACPSIFCGFQPLVA